MGICSLRLNPFLFFIFFIIISFFYLFWFFFGQNGLEDIINVWTSHLLVTNTYIRESRIKKKFTSIFFMKISKFWRKFFYQNKKVKWEAFIRDLCCWSRLGIFRIIWLQVTSRDRYWQKCYLGIKKWRNIKTLWVSLISVSTSFIWATNLICTTYFPSPPSPNLPPTLGH